MKKIFSILLILISPLLKGQIYSLTFVSGSSQIKLGTLNPGTGAVTEIAPNSIISDDFLSPNACIDPITKTYYLIKRISSSPYLCEIIGASILTGNIVSSDTLTFSNLNINFVNQLTFNCKDSSIYAISGDINNNSQLYISKVDIITGLVTPVSNSISTSFASPNACIDPISNTFYFINLISNFPYTYGLNGVNLTTGNVVSFDTLTFSDPNIDFVNQITFSLKDSSIYALSGLTSIYNELFISKVNVATGLVTPVSNSILSVFTAPNACIDIQSNIFYYIELASGLYNIKGVDLSNGNVTSTNQLNYSNGNTNYVNQIKFFNECNCQIATGIKNNDNENDLVIGPNPVFNNLITIFNLNNRSIIEMNLFDFMDNKISVPKSDLIDNRFIKLNNSIGSGAYILEITLSDNTIFRKKILNLTF